MAINWNVGAEIKVVNDGYGRPFVITKRGTKYATAVPVGETCLEIVFCKQDGSVNQERTRMWHHKNAIAYASEADYVESQRIKNERNRLAVRLHGSVCHWYLRCFEPEISSVVVDEIHKLLDAHGVK